jgi:hypothetical protein
VPRLQEPSHHVGAHSSKSDHSELHLTFLSLWLSLAV